MTAGTGPDGAHDGKDDRPAVGTTDQLVLCWGTLRECTFHERLTAAAAAGFDAISISPAIHEQATTHERLRASDLRGMLADHGLAVTELDPHLILPDLLEDIADGTPGVVAAEAALFSMAANVGAASLTVALPVPAQVSHDLAAAALAGIADRASAHGLAVQVEFLPWSDIPDLATAAALVQIAGRANLGVMFDSWHHIRSGADDGQVDASGPLVTGIQLSDTAAQPVASLMEETLRFRLLPGDGDGNVAGLLAGLLARGCSAPIGTEVFSDRLRAMPPVEAARLAGDSLREVVRAARARPARLRGDGPGGQGDGRGH